MKDTVLAPDWQTWQMRVSSWVFRCFGYDIANDTLERSDRFIEESLELVQATGYDKARAHVLVDYVFGRPVGDPRQEVGGVMVTLTALCNAHVIPLMDAAETEYRRINTPQMVEKIRAKQAAKPTGSALPIPQERIVDVDEGFAEMVHGLFKTLDEGYELVDQPGSIFSSPEAATTFTLKGKSYRLALTKEE